MPHHGGGFRSGGGGFHSGGGFRGGSGFRSGGARIFFGGGYYGGGGYGRGSPIRVLSFAIIAVVVIFIIIVSSARPKTKLYTTDLASNEQILLDLDTTWKSSVKVSSLGVVTTYLLPEIPKQLTTPLIVNGTRVLSIYAGGYEYYGFRLNYNSQIAINFTLASPAYFYVIQGDSDFANWEAGYTVSYLKQQYTSSLSFTLTANTDDMYYFTWENNAQSTSIGGSVFFLETLYQYDVSNALETCSDSYCSVSFDRGSSQVVLIQGNDSGLPDDVYTVNIQVNPRTSLFWIILFVIFGILGIVAASIVCVIKVCARSSSSTSNQSTPAPPPVSPEVGYSPEVTSSTPSAPPTVTLDAQSFPPPVYSPQNPMPPPSYSAPYYGNQPYTATPVQ